MNTVLAFLNENRQLLDLDSMFRPEDLTSVMITPRFRASRHVVFLIFHRNNPEPVMVAKISRLPGASLSLEREFANLQALHLNKKDSFDSVPRPIVFEQYQEHPILVETALTGQLMGPTVLRKDFQKCCTAVTIWLGEIPQPAPESEDPWFERLVQKPIFRFKEVFPLNPEEVDLFERTWELLTPLHSTELPTVFEHGDLSHPNIFWRGSGKIGVVDWELAEQRGIPTYDLFFFLTYVAFARNKARSSRDYLSAFQSAFFNRGAWARSYVDDYARRIGLPAAALTPLFILCWTRYLMNLLLRINETDQLGTETVAWMRANRFYTLWRYSLEHLHELDWGDLPRADKRSG